VIEQKKKGGIRANAGAVSQTALPHGWWNSPKKKKNVAEPPTMTSLFLPSPSFVPHTLLTRNPSPHRAHGLCYHPASICFVCFFFAFPPFVLHLMCFSRISAYEYRDGNSLSSSLARSLSLRHSLMLKKKPAETPWRSAHPQLAAKSEEEVY
jgi:hypothetical protein